MRIDCEPGHDTDHIPASVRRWCERSEPWIAAADVEAGFIEAMRDLSRWHHERSAWYRGWLDRNGVELDAIASLDDVFALPVVPANFFKQHEVLSVPAETVVLHLTSSGTTGQKSQMFFDEFTIGHARRMVSNSFRARGVISAAPAHYLVNAYEVRSDAKLGTSNTNQHLMQYAPPQDVFWSLRALDDGGHEFDAFGAVRMLQQWAQGDTPVRIIGFPAFLHFILLRMQRMGLEPLTLPAGSYVIFGGGWKGHADQAVPREELLRQIGDWLGIPAENVVETFGSVEHSIPYVGCSHQHLHVPVWSRVVIRDACTLAPLPYGQEGFLSFAAPYITSVPAHSVLMGDWAVQHPAGSCACGYPAPWFEVLGRAGTSSNKSCAAAAAELLPGQ